MLKRLMAERGDVDVSLILLIIAVFGIGLLLFGVSFGK